MAGAGTAPRASPDQLRLMSMTARLYHVHGLRQRDIGERLDISQARVSRLLRQSEAEGLVRTVVVPPEGLHADLEDALEVRYGVHEVHVVDIDLGADLASELGQAAARYLGEAGVPGHVIGFTSWSTTLQAMARALLPTARQGPRSVVEMLGGLGSPLHQHAASGATQALARAVGGDAVFLRAPGVLDSLDQRSVTMADPHVIRALALLDHVDTAFVGVGPPYPHSILQSGDRYFTPHQLEGVRACGAVGQLNQRFLDEQGGRARTPLDELVVGISLDQLRNARRRVIVAGGADKVRALAAALAGGWVDVLITDAVTAQELAGPVQEAGRGLLSTPRAVD